MHFGPIIPTITMSQQIVESAKMEFQEFFEDVSAKIRSELRIAQTRSGKAKKRAAYELYSLTVRIFVSYISTKY